MRSDKHMEQLNLFETDTQKEVLEPELTTSLKFPKSIEELSFVEVRDFPPFNDIEDAEIFTLSLTNNTSSLTHGLHRFPAKFIPQIPRWAIKQFADEGSCVLDPFMGSGTTLVEGLLHKGTTIGVDIDPLARMISHAKTDSLSSSKIVDLGIKLREAWEGPETELIPPMSGVANFDHWFSIDNWSKLQALFLQIQAIQCDESEKRFLLTIFSSILRWVSNADDQSQKTYVSGTLRKHPPEVLEIFWRSFQKAVRGLKSLELARNPQAQSIILETGEAASLDLPPHTVDLIVTSPPYLDSVDYMYNLMLEYFWLGPLLGIPDRQMFNQLRRQGAGAKQPERVLESIPEELRDLVELEHLPVARRKATAAYFDSMLNHFVEAARVMRPGARYVLVVGNSQTLTNIVPIHDCLIRLAEQAGLELEKAFAYRIRRHYMKFPRNGRGGIILIDWIIVLRKVSRPIIPSSRLPLPWATLGHKEVAN